MGDLVSLRQTTECTICKGYGYINLQEAVNSCTNSENLAVLSHMAPNLLKNKKTAEGGTRAKRLLQAGWKNDYLLTPQQLKCNCPERDTWTNFDTR